jgi:hypothetical protein
MTALPDWLQKPCNVPTSGYALDRSFSQARERGKCYLPNSLDKEDVQMKTRFLKSWLCKGMLAAAIALPAFSGGAEAQITDNDGCSNATLNGDYAFAVTGWTLSPGPLWVPNFVVGIGRFDGKGNFTQVDYPADGLRPSNGNLTDFRMGETGSYAVNPDCTGSQEINLNAPGVPPGTSGGVIENMFVISGGGRSIHGVVAEFTPPGGTQPVSVQTRVDFWKVGAEQDN